MLSIAVLGSGKGSNFQSILDAIQSGQLNARVVCVLSDAPDAYILQRARDHGIPAEYVDPAPFKTKLDGEAERRTIERLEHYGAQVLVLAGFMRMVKSGLLRAYAGRIINIHPALLPAFPGLASWKQALDYGAKVAGCTVHFVDEGMDTGPIILQRTVPVLDDDTPESLHARIQEQELIAYPLALQWISEGRTTIQNRRVLIRESSAQKVAPDLSGQRVLITAGPTVEDIDPIRFLSNRSSGKMGAALAVAAARRGAQVVLVHGPLKIPVPQQPGIEPVPVRSAQEMYEAVMTRVAGVQMAILCAAVADFTPVVQADRKLKKETDDLACLQLKRTPDILASVGALEKKPFLVGFAAETDSVERNAREKLQRKHCDLLCANDVSEPGSGFDQETNRITIYRKDGQSIPLPLLPKSVAADRILDEALAGIKA
ncbi:MAG: phosphoribosylglycinamide formyltransferase [Lentisphaerae bacterium GWF2_57_35]|nr:MAG: phosphoribosylglycinamide formyltransferase [Lentisphaerae bacterium GWF2_57_35]